MADPTKSQIEHPSAYFVQDRSNQEEMIRLQLQDQLITTSMGGVLPEQPDPASFQRVLDVGSGTGGWLIEVAKAYPTIKLLIGVDVSQKMVDYAKEQAKAQGVGDRVEFHVMNALRTLEFPNAFFDLINQRLGWSWVRVWEWPKLLEEFQRVAQPGGTIRITEGGWMTGNSDAMMKLHHLALEASFYSGHLFIEDQNNSIIDRLPGLLERYGVQHIQTWAHNLTFPAETPQGKIFHEDIQHLFHVALPFMHRWAHVPDDYEVIYQQMLEEAQRPDFVGQWSFLTAWGEHGRSITSETP
ncbi:MAG TPA: methyltransferase domain-containing protein [Ktedonosporobacter sp.]|nr:methyltransferase domain-containing protein [Ktedonosporobacter sp.]